MLLLIYVMYVNLLCLVSLLTNYLNIHVHLYIHSGVGFAKGANFNDTQRTSTNSWIERQRNPMIDSFYRRAADVLRVDESLLVHDKTVESLQVVHYDPGQKYDAHHDWASTGARGSRYITLLLYLTDQTGPMGGGETEFPKGKTAKGKGFKVKPKKGQAVLFYNLLPDGNADDLSLHAALAVTKGEKWLANFWVWDPRILMGWDDTRGSGNGKRRLLQRKKTKTIRL